VPESNQIEEKTQKQQPDNYLQVITMERFKKHPSIQDISRDIDRWQTQLPNLSEHYVRELQGFLQIHHADSQAKYCQHVLPALRRAHPTMTTQTKQLSSEIVRRLDDSYGIVMSFPIINEQITGYHIQDGRIYRPSIILPNGEHYPIKDE
jgi:citrate synthase